MFVVNWSVCLWLRLFKMQFDKITATRWGHSIKTFKQVLDGQRSKERKNNQEKTEDSVKDQVKNRDGEAAGEEKAKALIKRLCWGKCHLIIRTKRLASLSPCYQRIMILNAFSPKTSGSVSVGALQRQKSFIFVWIPSYFI